MKFWTVLLVLLLVMVAPVMAGEWRSIDQTSKLTYIATYEKEPIEGKFQQFSVVVQTNNKTAALESLNVRVAVNSADMSSDDINDAIRGAEWFDVNHFATAEFNAAAIEKKDVTHYMAHGTLKLKGIEKKLDLPFVWNVDSQKALLTGEVVLKRSDFSIGTGEWLSGDQIGLDVNVHFSVELHENK